MQRTAYFALSSCRRFLSTESQSQKKNFFKTFSDSFKEEIKKNQDLQVHIHSCDDINNLF